MDNETYIKEISLPMFCKGCKEFKFNEINLFADGKCVEKDYSCANINFCTYLRELWKEQEYEKENAR